VYSEGLTLMLLLVYSEGLTLMLLMLLYYGDKDQKWEAEANTYQHRSP